MKHWPVVPVLFAGLLLLACRSAAPPTPVALPAGWSIIRPPHDVMALALQGETLWAGGQEGVWAVNTATREATPFTGANDLRYVRALLVDHKGALWIGHQRGLTRCLDGSCRTYKRADGLPDDRVNALLQDSQGYLWVGTWGGAACRKGDTWSVLRAADGLAENMVNVMLEDNEGGLWFGSYVAPRGGLSRLQNGQWQRWTVADGLPHNNITALLQDEQSNVWVGTGLYDRGGAVRLSRNKAGWSIVEVLRQQDGLAGAKVRSLFQDVSGVLWFGSEYDGLARWDGHVWQVLKQADGLASNEIKVMLQDSSGNLWLGTRDGLTVIGCTNLPKVQNLPGGPVAQGGAR